MGDVTEESDTIDSLPIEQIEKTLNDGLIRNNSVTVSQWGLEHNLKLLEEKKVSGDEARDKTEKLIDVDARDSTLPSDNAEINDLILPSTPQRTHAASDQTKSSNDTSDWWYQALAQSEGIDDYDSLMDNLGDDDTGKLNQNNQVIAGQQNGLEAVHYNYFK